ncbi:MAG: isoaspartyl peptidase/L-asparaginase family protein [Candidatus Sericytochromatia bacterium]
MAAHQAVLLIHGGAGTLFTGALPPEREAQVRAGLEQALRAGTASLAEGASAQEAVVAAVCVLEDCEVFNAGRGAVYTHKGTQEMDAAVMRGKDRAAGAIAGVQGIRNPILLAQAVLEHSPHVLLAGQGAEEFADAQHIPRAPAAYFHSDYRWQQLQEIRAREDAQPALGTVGAVARDVYGHLAAATSTGGMTNKRYGRIGDSPLLGAGTWADAQCAVSGTGHGEYFMRAALAHDLAARLSYQGLSLQAAAEAALAKVAALGGAGGLIAVDANGNWAMPFNTGRMYRGWRNLQGDGEIALYT